jgi:ribonuclease HI
MRPIFNLEPKYGVTVLTREAWTKGTGVPSAVKGLVWFTDGSRMEGRAGARDYWQSVGRRLSFSLGRYMTVFQAEIFAILACVYDIRNQHRSERYVSICSDSQAALNALKAVRTTSPMVLQCQRVLNDISSRHVVGLYWVPGHAGIGGNEIADEFAREGSTFLGPEPALGVSKQIIQQNLNRWLVNQHRIRWQSLGCIPRQARELTSEPSPVIRARFLSFTRAQARVVTGMLIGHNTLRRHLHLLGMADSPMCRRCGMEDETSAHIVCECEALASPRHAYLGSFFMEPRDIMYESLGAIYSYV